MLQPFDSDSTDHSKHRFMVQSMFAPDEPVENIDQLVSFVIDCSWVCYSHLSTHLYYVCGCRC